MLCAYCKSILVAREAVGQLGTNRRVAQWANKVVIGSSDSITFVIPVNRQQQKAYHLYGPGYDRRAQSSIGKNIVPKDFQI